MTNHVKLVVADIDGTLVDDVNHEMMPVTKKALHILQDHGVYLGIASGRSVDQTMKNRIKKWGFEKPFELLIGLNGGEIYDEVHHTKTEFYKLKKEYVKEIIEMMAPFNLNPFIYRDDYMLASRMDKDMEASSKRNSQGVHIAKDISELYETDISKIMFRMSAELMPKAEERVASFGEKPYRAFKTQTTMLEFMDKRINKGNALRKFCEDNEIALEDVIAFGDMTNDNELLETAGWGVCLCNGNEETKAISNDITIYDNNHDGLGYYLMEKVIHKKEWD